MRLANALNKLAMQVSIENILFFIYIYLFFIFIYLFC